MPIAPLFETLDDLRSNADDVMSPVELIDWYRGLIQGSKQMRCASRLLRLGKDARRYGRVMGAVSGAGRLIKT